MELIVVVGVGALGSHTLLCLRNLKVSVKIIDCDVIEAKNVLAQMHTKMSLGQNKALAAKQAFFGMFGWKVEANPHRVTPDNVAQVFKGATLLVDCTDNIAAREVIQGYARQTGTPCVHGSVSAEGNFARVMWTEHFKADAEGQDGQATCEDGEQLPFFVLAGAHLAQEVKQFLKDKTKRSFQFSPTSVQRLV